MRSPVAVGTLTLLLATSIAPCLRAQATCSAVGSERWDVKTAAPLGAGKSKAIGIARFATLDVPAPVQSKKKGAKMIQTRYTDPIAGGFREGQLVSVTGWVRLIKTSDDDCDYHIQVEPTKTGHDGMIIVEVPEPDAAHVTDASLRQTLEKVRETLRTGLKLPGEPKKSHGNVIGSAHMTFEGALFFDAPHSPSCGKRGTGDTAVTCWEIHPVTAVRFATKPKP